MLIVCLLQQTGSKQKNLEGATVVIDERNYRK